MMLWEWDSEARWRITRLPDKGPFRVSHDTEILALPSECKCVVLTRGNALVNGCSALPLQVLNDRDELRVEGKLYYFSTQSPTEVVAFAKGNDQIRCARCSVWLEDEDAVIYCSACKGAHHADCYSYAPECGSCRASTRGISWTPEAPEKKKI